MKNYGRLMSIASLAIALVIVIKGTHATLSSPVTAWFATSAIIWMLLLLASSLWLIGGSFPSLAATGLAATVVGRLFSTVQLQDVTSAPGSGAADLLLQVETGPGLPGFGLLSALLGILVLVQFIGLGIHDIRTGGETRQSLIQTWALTFLRLYAGLMFVPHFVGHILAGPHQFEIYSRYFAGLGLPIPAAQLVLAGTVELAAAIGLVFGLWTRMAALIGAMYLFLTMFLGGHFSIGYVWILPDGGYEFGIFWSVVVGLFTIVGGGAISLDNIITRWVDSSVSRKTNVYYRFLQLAVL